MIARAELNTNGEAKCFLEAVQVVKVLVAVTRMVVILHSWGHVPKGWTATDDIPVLRCSSGTGVKCLPECEFCAGPGRLIHTKLPGSALRGTEMLHPSHSSSETATPGSRKGAGSHGGNNINYRSCFSSLELPMAWHQLVLLLYFLSSRLSKKITWEKKSLRF